MELRRVIKILCIILGLLAGFCVFFGYTPIGLSLEQETGLGLLVLAVAMLL